MDSSKTSHEDHPPRGGNTRGSTHSATLPHEHVAVDTLFGRCQLEETDGRRIQVSIPVRRRATASRIAETVAAPRARSSDPGAQQGLSE